jgi:hypothetical protein
MITDVVQRWRERRADYRPIGEPIQTSDYEVAAIPDDTTAKGFICRHHYSGSFPAARFRYGLYNGASLAGVVVFSHPANNLTLTNVFPGDPLESVELGRLVLLDDVPANGESWLIARCFELLRREHIVGVVSFSDPFPRTNMRGDIVFKGHIGNIYQASNAVYLGRARPDTMRLLPDGSVLSARTLAKIRGSEKGIRYGAALLHRHGAEPLRRGEDARAWIERWLPRVTRTLRHPGNHRYAFGLNRAAKRRLPASKPYPKFNPSPQRTAA